MTDQQLETEAVKEIEHLPMNSIIKLGKDQDVLELPVSPNPIYVVAQEGIFLRKHNVLGDATFKAKDLPKSIGKMGNTVGWHHWTAPTIPPELCAQIVDFFKRIWDKHQTEAEVLLTARCGNNPETGLYEIQEWKVFVPTQKVSSGAVESVFEPTHIAKDHLVVGTMHSHCNFSAFHSGVDTADADKMDGVHFTIGYVDRDIPEVVAMVASNGIRVTYNPEALADFSKLDAAKAPEWWDNYVIPSKNLQSTHKPPVGFSNFEKYGSKPSVTNSGKGQDHVGTPHYSSHGYEDYWDGDYGEYYRRWYENDNDDAEWEEFWASIKKDDLTDYQKRELRTKWSVHKSYHKTWNSGTCPFCVTVETKKDDSNDKGNVITLKELIEQRGGGISEEEWKKANAEEDKNWLLPERGSESRTDDQRLFKDQINNAKFWEDEVTAQVRDLVYESNLLTEEDWLVMSDNAGKADVEWLKSNFIHKIIEAVTCLEPLGIKMSFTMEGTKPQTMRNQRLSRKQRRELERNANTNGSNQSRARR